MDLIIHIHHGHAYAFRVSGQGEVERVDLHKTSNEILGNLTGEVEGPIARIGEPMQEDYLDSILGMDLGARRIDNLAAEDHRG